MPNEPIPPQPAGGPGGDDEPKTLGYALRETSDEDAAGEPQGNSETLPPGADDPGSKEDSLSVED